MRKSTSLKISIFALLSAVICAIGNHLLEMDVLTAVIHGLGFASYLFLAISISQVIYEKVRFAVNLIVLFMSFAMALYCIMVFSITPFVSLLDYYVLFFYMFVLLCLISAILLLGRIIFYSPKAKVTEDAPANMQNSDDKITWVCVCGNKNTGNFCSACGALHNKEKNAEANNAVTEQTESRDNHTTSDSEI